MSLVSAESPNIPHLFWMLVMQPLRLHQWLAQVKQSEPDCPAWQLWHSEERTSEPCWGYLWRMGLLIPVLALGSAVATVFLLTLERFLVFNSVIIAIAFTGALGAIVIGIGLALAFGAAYGVAITAAMGVTLTGAVSVVFGMLAGVSPGRDLGFLLGIAGGTAVSLALDSARGVGRGDARGSIGIIASSLVGAYIYGLLFYLVVGCVNLQFSTVAGVRAGVGFAAAFVSVSLRLPFYILESLIQSILYYLESVRGIKTLRFSPVLFHDLSKIPHPWLFRHVLVGAEADPETAERVRKRCIIVSGQRALAARLLPFFQVGEIKKFALTTNFTSAFRLQGEWLPGVEGASPWLLNFREAARFLVAAQATPIPYYRFQHLEAAEEILAGLEHQILEQDSLFADALRQCLGAWNLAAAQLRKETETAAVRQIPNPFRTEPLTPDQEQLFRGREALVRRIENLLADPADSFSLALVGPRRCGKTSLLLMLPKLLPDAICIFFDLQDNPLDSPGAFFKSLAYRAREQSLRDHRITLPALPVGPPLEAARDWLEELDKLGAQHRILLCFDEFERLEEFFPGEPPELRKLLGLFRGTIQHRKRLRLLVSGAAPFDELGTLWNDSFINLRELRIGHLDRKAAVELLCSPIPEFPTGTISLQVAEAIFKKTGGQPYLVQLYGSLLVSLLNEEARAFAIQDDVEKVEDRVLSEAKYYFRYLVRSVPPEAYQALVTIANGRAPLIDPNMRNWLRRRSLLADDGALGIPILGAFLRNELDI